MPSLANIPAVNGGLRTSLKDHNIAGYWLSVLAGTAIMYNDPVAALISLGQFDSGYANLYEGFLSVNLAPCSVILNATLYLYGSINAAQLLFDVEVRRVAAYEFVPGGTAGSIEANPLLAAHLVGPPETSRWKINDFNAIPLNVANLLPGANNLFLLNSSRSKTDTDFPAVHGSTTEHVQFYSYSHVTIAKRPYLEVNYIPFASYRPFRW